MSKFKNAEAVSNLCRDLSNALAENVSRFPGLAPAILALTKAAEDPMANPDAVKKTKKPVKVNPVKLSYTDKDILVKTPWGQAGKALQSVFKRIVGRRGKSINPETGELWYLTTYDKKAKACRIPKDKEAEVMAAIKASGLPVETAA